MSGILDWHTPVTPWLALVGTMPGLLDWRTPVARVSDRFGTHLIMSRDLTSLGERIAEHAAHLDAAMHRLLSDLREFDQGGGWHVQGARSCAHWLSWRVGWDLGTAREHVRVAGKLADLPGIDQALQRGELSFSKVRAMTRVATAENEASLLAMARSSTASQLERIRRGYRRALRGMGDERPEDEVERRYVRIRETESGLVRIEAQLTAEEGAVVRQALDLVASRAWRARRAASSGCVADVSAETRAQGPADEDVPAGTSLLREPRVGFATEPPIPAGLRRADALVALTESYLAEARDGGRDGRRVARRDDAGPPVEIVVHVEADGQAAVARRSSCRCEAGSLEAGLLEDGTPLAGATVERLACDATVVRVVEDSRGNVLDVGRRRRTISTGLRRALRLRDDGCRFPGCTNRLTDGHHVVPWSRGGETSLTNLVSLCRRHHRFVHELGFRIERVDERAESRRFAFLRPSGFEVKFCGEPPALGGEPVADLLARHRAVEIEIDPDTSYPEWDGTRPDYDHIVGCLMQREEQRSLVSPDRRESRACANAFQNRCFLVRVRRGS